MTDPSVSNPEWKYDQDVQMGYLKFAETPVVKTQSAKETARSVIVDLDENGSIVGVEIFF